jgi:hypothetical protein
MKWIILITTLLSLTACEKIALMFTPEKKPLISNSPLEAEAEHYFWETLHQGQYDHIPKANDLLMAAYLQNPNNPKLAAHLGFLHMWLISERARMPGNNPLITNEIILSKHYFQDALTMDPNNPIYQGFLGDAMLIEAQIAKDKREEVQGYFQLKRSIAAWPEFNYFTAGYPMSTLPADSEHFQEALKWQWLTLDLCAGKKIDRKNPDYRSAMQQQTNQDTQRACWNSTIAPYNFEGFFMNMGDMLVKSKDWQTAIIIYKNAMLADNYSSWPYRNVLENKISNAKANVRFFQNNNTTPEHRLMINSKEACMACHQVKT